MIVKKMRGFRDLSEIEIEGYFSTREPTPLLPVEEKPRNAKDDRPEVEGEISKTFPNPFVSTTLKEATKGILHFFKEK